MVGSWVDPEMVELIDQARGYMSASQFFRNALYNEMERAGVKVPQRLLYGRDRKGVGGRPRKEAPGALSTEPEGLLAADAAGPAVSEQRIKDLRYEKAKRPKKGPKK